MSTAYYLNVTVHVLAALYWLGGMFFLAAVGAPALRGLESPALRARLFAEIGRRFRTSGWIAIGVLVLTGLGNLHFRGLLSGDVLGSAGFWSSAYGTALGWKLGLVTVMLAVSAVHDFVLGPRSGELARRARAASPAAAPTPAPAAGDGDPSAGSPDPSPGSSDPSPAADVGAVARRGARYRRWAAWLARVNALLGLALVYVAVRLARGG